VKYSERERHFKYVRPGLDRRQRRGVCGKISYRSRSEAKTARKQLMGSGTETNADLQLHIYWCSPCDAFHLGHSTPSRSRSHERAE
jgi:hypothetical protein